jgi:hypothetical protein
MLNRAHHVDGGRLCSGVWSWSTLEVDGFVRQLQLQGYQIARQRFLLEAKSAAGLDHPYICKIREISRTDDGQASIALGPRVKMGISS